MVEKENDIIATQQDNNGNGATATGASATVPAKELPNKNGGGGGEDLKGLAYSFLKEYYTKLSDNPAEAGIFFGDDSSFVHDDVEENGRENIQRAIAAMGFEDCKARFYSVKTVSLKLDEDVKVLHVCGELSLKKGQVKEGPHRFVQTIVLAHRTPTLLYVKSNIFQFIDTAFMVNADSSKYANMTNFSPSPPVAAAMVKPAENGEGGAHAAMVNGGGETYLPVQNKGEPIVEDNPTSVVRTLKVNNIDSALAQPVAGKGTETNAAVTPLAASQVQAVEHQSPPQQANTMPEEFAAVEKNTKPATTAPPGSATASNNAPAQAVQQPQKPVRAIGGSYAAIAASAQQPQGQPMQPRVYQQPQQQPPKSNNTAANTGAIMGPQPTAVVENKPNAPPQQQRVLPAEESTGGGSEAKKAQQPQSGLQQRQTAVGTNSPPPFVAPRREWTHRAYFTQLTKPNRYVDQKGGQRELMKELLAITTGVEFVGIKPSSLRRESKAAFGFIDFTTAADMQAVYDACKKGDGGTRLLKASIPAFEFNGYLALSADKFSGYNGGVQQAAP